MVVRVHHHLLNADFTVEQSRRFKKYRTVIDILPDVLFNTALFLSTYKVNLINTRLVERHRRTDTQTHRRTDTQKAQTHRCTGAQTNKGANAQTSKQY